MTRPRVALRFTRGYRPTPRWGVFVLGVDEIGCPRLVGGHGLALVRLNKVFQSESI